jgi:hypothetical protein
MATISFSVPDDVRDRFNEVFAGHNKSAVITTLLLHAIAEEERRRRSLSLVERLRLLNGRSRPPSEEAASRSQKMLRDSG